MIQLIPCKSEEILVKGELSLLRQSHVMFSPLSLFKHEAVQQLGQRISANTGHPGSEGDLEECTVRLARCDGGRGKGVRAAGPRYRPYHGARREPDTTAAHIKKDVRTRKKGANMESCLMLDRKKRTEFL